MLASGSYAGPETPGATTDGSPWGLWAQLPSQGCRRWVTRPESDDVARVQSPFAPSLLIRSRRQGISISPTLEGLDEQPFSAGVASHRNCELIK